MVRVKTYVELWEYVEHSDCVLIEKFKGGRYVNVIFKGNKRHKKRAQLKAPLYLESYVMVIPPLEQENKELSKTPTNTTKVQICPATKEPCDRAKLKVVCASAYGTCQHQGKL